MYSSKAVPKTIFVAVDGSEASQKAFKVALYELLGQGDHIVVSSITNVSKVYLPDEYKPKTLYSLLNAELVGNLVPSRYMIVFEESKPGKTTKDQLLDLSISFKTDYMIIGWHGRKGPKEDPTIMGSTCSHLVYKSKAPLIIIKKYFKREKNPSKGYNFLVCTDGSEKSLEGFDHAKKLAIKTTDKIYGVSLVKVLGCEKNDIEELVTNKIKNLGTHVEMEYIEGTELEPHNSLLNFINQTTKIEFDFVLIGMNGFHGQKEGKHEFGRTAQVLLQKVYINPIIIPQNVSRQ